MGRSARAQARLLAGSAETMHKMLSPYVFEEDLISPDGGDDYLLFDVLKTTFIKRKYADAVNAFLYAADAYPSLAKKWIDSSLDFMQLPKN